MRPRLRLLHTRYRFKAAHKTGRDILVMLRAKVDETAALAKSRPLLQVQRCRSAERALLRTDPGARGGAAATGGPQKAARSVEAMV